MEVSHIISKAGDEDYVFSILYDNEALIAYCVTENGEKLIDSFEGEEIDVKGNTFSIKGVKFGENIKLANGSAYILKYGKKQEGYMYCELEFVK